MLTEGNKHQIPSAARRGVSAEQPTSPESGRLLAYTPSQGAILANIGITA